MEGLNIDSREAFSYAELEAWLDQLNRREWLEEMKRQDREVDYLELEEITELPDWSIGE